MTKTIKELLDDFVEKGADLEHERWSKWQSYFFSKCQVKPQSQVNGMDDRYVYLALPKDLYDRWNRQMNTLYPELSEQERESDRIEVRKYLPLVSSITSQVEALVRREVLEEVEREVDKLRGVTDRHMTEEQYNDVHQSNAFINHISTIINNLRVK